MTAREILPYDVVIVGGGPAGLAAAIRLKQAAAKAGKAVTVALLEKGSEIGAHILSGAVIDPSGLAELFSDWRARCDVLTPVRGEQLLFLREKGAISLDWLPMPGWMRNHGNYTGSLADLCRWLAREAEALGVEIYPGMAASELVFDDQGAVKGVAAGEFGRAKDGTPKPNYQPSVELHDKYLVLAEGARGSLSEHIIARFGLAKGRSPQKYGLGIKEIWQVPEKHFRPGFVQHGFGWPLGDGVGGGSFVYHFGDRYVAVGLVVHLDYANPYLSPFEEFQKLKSHPAIRAHVEGGKRIGYGTRVITEGGWQSVPQLAFPGGVLVGCAAGFVNVPRIKGSHNAIKTGMMAADAIFAALEKGSNAGTLETYQRAYEQSAVSRELKRVRNVKPLWSRFGTAAAIALGGLDMWIATLLGGFSFFGTLKHKKTDAEATGLARDFAPPLYAKPDGVLSFDRLSSVYLANTAHDENQPVHLRLKDPAVPLAVNLPRYGEPARLYCPAGVYEVTNAAGEILDSNAIAKGDTNDPARFRFVINAANCVHCKTCDIKDPSRNIVWTVPEGGSGPHYGNM